MNKLLRNVWDTLTKPSAVLTEVGERRNARLASSFLLAIMVLILTGILLRIPRLGFVNAFLGPIGYAFFILIADYTITRTRWYRVGVFLFSLSFSALAFGGMVNQGDSADPSGLVLIYVPLALIVAASFLSNWALFLLVGLNVGAYFYVQFLGVNVPESIMAQVGVITVIGTVLIILRNFRNTTERLRLEELQKVNRELDELSSELEQRVTDRTSELEQASKQLERRAKQFEAISQVSRTISSIQKQEELLPLITDMISQYFDFYHVGIFMTDIDQKFAVLRASNSAGGQKMLARGHRLEIGQTGIVGYVTAVGEPRIALDVGADAAYFDNPDLPDTRSEMALPLLEGNDVIGALDVQSTQENAFSQEDINILSALVDQVSATIHNARLYESTSDALAQAERATRQLARQSWREIQHSENILGYRFNGTKPEPLSKTEDIAQAKTKDGSYSIPVQLRGETIGNLSVKPPSDGYHWSDDEIILIRATAERVALAAENARLVLESQKRATKEQTISEISSKIGASIRIDNIIQTTVRELGIALDASDVVFQLVETEKDGDE